MTEAIDDFEITGAMLVYGGSFVQALGKAWRVADSDNRATLKAAFPLYWKKYAELAALKRQQMVRP